MSMCRRHFNKRCIAASASSAGASGRPLPSAITDAPCDGAHKRTGSISGRCIAMDAAMKQAAAVKNSFAPVAVRWSRVR